jgi:hypothetical protein
LAPTGIVTAAPVELLYLNFAVYAPFALRITQFRIGTTVAGIVTGGLRMPRDAHQSAGQQAANQCQRKGKKGEEGSIAWCSHCSISWGKCVAGCLPALDLH